MSSFLDNLGNFGKKAKTTSDECRQHLARIIGFVKGVMANYGDILTKDQENSITEVYLTVNGVTDTYNFLNELLEIQPQLKSKIISIYTNEANRMNRQDEPIVINDENQRKLYAIAFIHGILTEETPDLTYRGNLVEEDVKAYVNKNVPLGHSKEELERMDRIDIDGMPTGTTDNVPTGTTDNADTGTVIDDNQQHKRKLAASFGGKKSKKNKSKKSRKSRKHRK